MGLFRRNEKKKPVGKAVTEEKAVVIPVKGEMEPCIAFHSPLKEWTAEEWRLQERLKEMIFQQLSLAMKTGDVAGAEAQTLVLLHGKWLHLFWKEGMYTKQNHLMIGKIYVAEPRFAQFYDARVGKGGAVFLRDSIEIYVLRGGAVEVFPPTKKAVDSGRNGLDSGRNGLDSGRNGLDSGRKGLDSGDMVTVARRRNKK